MSGNSTATISNSTVVRNEQKIVYVEFDDGDQRDPQNYPLLKKWAITLTACYFTGMAGAAASSFSISTPSLRHDLRCTESEATLGLGLYAFAFAIVPLVTSSFSEEFGRRSIYIFSSVLFTLTQVMVALAPNIGVVLAGRFLQGTFGSTGVLLVGGSISDIWRPNERGLPMTLYAFSHVFSLGLGSVIGGVIQSNLGWRWVQWVHVMFSSVFVILVLLVMTETRSSIILSQIAQSKRRLTGESIYQAKSDIEKESLWVRVKTSCTRPLYFLFTEPLVQSFSIWAGFTWGVVFCLLEAVSPMFETIYSFDVQQTGYVYATMCIGAIIGFFANLYQDVLYRRYFHRKQQEARLYVVCVAALCLPIGISIFAWTASPRIHWIAPLIGLTVFMSGVMIIFQAMFLYLADCYNTYASSAQAGQNLSRNTMGLVFPLFSSQVFSTLTYKWGLTIIASLALAMAPVPYVLFFYGSKIRARSFASRKILDADRQAQQLSRESFVVFVDTTSSTDGA